MLSARKEGPRANTGLSATAGSPGACYGIVSLIKRCLWRLINQACALAKRENVCSYKAIANLADRLLTAALADIDAPFKRAGPNPATSIDPGRENFRDLLTLGP